MKNHFKKATKQEYHADIAPAFITYRKQMELACYLRSDLNNYRIYTEPRAYGARSKYYGGSNMPINTMNAYIKNNPSFRVGNTLYAVSIKYSQYKTSQASRVSLYCSCVTSVTSN